MNLGMSSRQSRSGRDMRPVRAARSSNCAVPWDVDANAPRAGGAIVFRETGLDGTLICARCKRRDRRRVGRGAAAPAVEPGVAVKPLPTWQARPSNRPLPGTATARVQAARGGAKRDAPGKKLRGG